MPNVKMVEVTEENINKYPPRCFLKTDNPGFLAKVEWLKRRFSEGLRIKQTYVDEKLIGFIEYVYGENAWRAVDSKDYLFIHCIWIYPNANKNKGYASLLVNEVIKDAEKEGKLGVSVVASEGAFMADKRLFLKNGFEIVEESKPFSLLVKKLKDGDLPKFRDWKKQLEKFNGFHILYSNQCPWVSRFLLEIRGVIKKKDLKLRITELKTPKDAQNAPSIYASFNLINNGKLLADHYISVRRFESILKKEGI